ncbi:conserved hypothetical protein [Solidesulfovibrio fructosivorans JJ]]|uniref:Uncharacterized protein n=1 Tax=Solidesulfovibrio fructosivorans JJ] TaxID=596151 RepID=E1JTC2_SOLFR|nr:conserved hypothetical protein [Solidesulfovibrio fructosivorans JJ]]
MSIVLCLFVVGVFAFLAYTFRVDGRSTHRYLPRDFDFDLYKTREFNVRGLFDTTKWK